MIDPKTGLEISPTPSIDATKIGTVATPTVPSPTVVPTSAYTAPINSTASTLQAQFDAQTAQRDAEQKLAQSQQVSSDVASLQSQMGGKGLDTANQYKTSGVNTAYNQLQDINAQMTGLKNEASAIPIQLQNESLGQGRTAQGIAPLETARLRDNALKALSLGQQAAVAEGNYNKAKNLADQQVDIKYSQLEADLKSKQTQLDALDKYSLTPSQEKAKEVRATALKKEEQDIADKKANDKEVNNLIVEASQFAPPDILAKAQSIKDVGGSSTQVAQALGQYGKDYLTNQKLKAELAKIKEETNKIYADQATAQATQQTPEVNAWVSNINSGKAKLTDVPQKLKSAVSLGLSTASTGGNQAKLDGYKSVLTNVNDILNSSALTAVVGPSPLGRIGYGYNRATGDMQDFTAKVDQLTQGLTLQSLIDSKAKGATFGALSEGELSLLAKSATRLNSYRKLDSNGNIYYDVNESGFKSAVNDIKDLTQKAYAKEGGADIVVPTGNAQADAYFKASSGALQNTTSSPYSSAGYVDNQAK